MIKWIKNLFKDEETKEITINLNVSELHVHLDGDLIVKNEDIANKFKPTGVNNSGPVFKDSHTSSDDDLFGDLGSKAADVQFGEDIK